MRVLIVLLLLILAGCHSYSTPDWPAVSSIPDDELVARYHWIDQQVAIMEGERSSLSAQAGGHYSAGPSIAASRYDEPIRDYRQRLATLRAELSRRGLSP